MRKLRDLFKSEEDYQNRNKPFNEEQMERFRLEMEDGKKAIEKLKRFNETDVTSLQKIKFGLPVKY